MTTEGGATPFNSNSGLLFEDDLAIDSFKTIINFGTAQYLPTGPLASLIEPVTGKLYGATMNGPGSGGPGSLFEYDLNTQSISLKYSLMTNNYDDQLRLKSIYIELNLENPIIFEILCGNQLEKVLQIKKNKSDVGADHPIGPYI